MWRYNNDSEAVYWRCAGCGAVNDSPHDRECSAWSPEETVSDAWTPEEGGWESRETEPAIEVQEWQILFARDTNGAAGEN